MRNIVPIFIFAIFFCFSAQAIPIAVFTSDQPGYTIGQRAILRVGLQTEPENKNLEFFVVVKDQNSLELPLERLAAREYWGFSSVFDSPGSYTFTAEVFLQNIDFSASLAAAISFHNSEIARIDSLLPDITDPQEIENLLRERHENEVMRDAAISELARHRKKVDGTKTLTIQVQ